MTRSVEGRKPFHVVRIMARGYSLLASYADRAEARQHVLADTLRTGSCLLRDGLTGKRYCPAELRYTDAEVTAAKPVQS